MRRAKEMCVVRHQDVAPNGPFACLAPDIAQTSMDLVAGKPRFAILRADRKEDDGRLADVDLDSASRTFAPDTLGGAREGAAPAEPLNPLFDT